MSFEVIVITSEKDYLKETEVICQLFKQGLKTLHVRKPDATVGDLKKYISSIPKRFHKRIVLHSQYQLIKEFNLKGAHLTEKIRLKKKESDKLKRQKIKIVSSSFHTYEEILKSRRKYDYVFLSPVFGSISKQGYKSKFDLKILESFLLKDKTRIIALGGISTVNINTVKHLGFFGAAVLGYVWKGKDPVKKYQKLISKIK